MKRYLALIIAAVLLFTTACGASATDPAATSPSASTGVFSDVSENADYAPAVAWCYDNKPTSEPDPTIEPTPEPSSGASQSDVDEWVKGLYLIKENTNTMSKIKVSFNGMEYTATLSDNSSAEAFFELLRSSGGSIAVNTSDYGGFEKVGELGTTLPRNDEQITTSPGDIILYLGSNITLYYDVNSWSFTRLGRLDGDVDGAALRSQLGTGDVTITFALAD